MTRADVGRVHAAAVLEDHGAQDGALRERQPLPRGLEHCIVLGQESRQRLVKMIERRAPRAAGTHLVPCLVREALNVVRQVAGELDDCAAEPVLGLHARSNERRIDERLELFGRNLLEAHHRSRFVERPLRSQHSFHQAGLRSGEHVTNAALLLHRGAQRVLDRTAVERGDGLELVERDDDVAAPRLGKTAGQREHLFGEA